MPSPQVAQSARRRTSRSTQKRSGSHRASDIPSGTAEGHRPGTRPGGQEERHVRFMIVGGLAAHYYCREREADDLDVLVEHTEANAIYLCRALASLGFSGAFDPVDFASRRSIQIPWKVDLFADILTPSPGFDFPYEYSLAADVVVGRVLVNVAARSTLAPRTESATRRCPPRI
jgi:hypothetical protein